MKHFFSLAACAARTRRLVAGHLLLLLTLLPWAAQAQTPAPAWQLALSGNNNQPGTGGTSITRATATDSRGNVFITGNFLGSVSFGGTRLTSAGSNDVFVAKWDATAQAFTWATSGGGTGADQGNGIAVSGTSVYVTGYFASATSASFAGQPLSGAGGTDMFVAKYTDTSTGSTPATSSFANGWATSGGGTGTDIGNGIAVSGTSVYVTGYFASATSASIAGQALAGAGAGSNDMFVAKYTDTSTGSTPATSSFANGWATSGGGTGADQGNGIAVSGTSVYVTGYFASATSASFAGQPLSGAGGTDMFVAKYTDTSTGSTPATSSFANGWATSGGGTGTDIGYGIAVSGTSVYVTGYFASATSASFAGQPLAGAGGTDMFVAKYTDTSTGSTPATSSFANGWATSGGGTNGDIGYGIAVSGTSVYVTGSFISATNASIAGQPLAGAGFNDVFVAKYTDTSTGSTPATSSFANGWAASGGGTSNDIGYGIAVSGTSVYAGGQVGIGVATFGPAVGRVLAPAGSGVLGGLDPATGTWQRAEGPLQGGTSATRATATDSRGNVFITGSFSGSVSFGGTRLTSAGSNDVFVAKWDATAQAFTWATSGGGTGNDVGYGLAVSGTSVYVTGSFTSATSASFAGQPLAGAGNTDVFVAKYTDTSTGSTPATSSFANGWATRGGGTSADIGNGIAVSGTSVYVTGSFTSATSASFAGQPLTGAGGTDVFVAKYTDTSTGSTPATSSFANGWATSGGGTSDDIGNGLAVSGTSVYVTGYFASATSTSFAGQPLSGAGGIDMFVAKYTDTSTGSTPATSSFANGWATRGGGTGSDFGNGLAVSGTSVYVTGYFFSATSASFAGQALAGAGGTDMFVAKYTDTSTGSTPATSSFANGWATSGGGTSTDYGFGLAVSGTSVYVTGSFTSATSASFAGQALAGAGSDDVFVAKYTDTSTGSTPATSSFANGWATSGGGTSADQGNGIAVSGTSVYAGGQVTPPATFGSSTFGNSVSGQINFLGELRDVPPAPVISSFSPTSGPAGQVVTILGTNFTGATAVAFNSTAAASFVVNSSTQLTATVAAGSTTGTISVTTPGGTATSASVFTVCAAPVATAQNVSVTLDASGQATVTATAVNNGSTADCGLAAAGTLSVSPSTFTCANLGANTVTLTVTDAGGNTATTTATVTVSMPATPTTTWTGTAGTAWTDCANWSFGKVPDATTDVVVPAGLSRYPSLTAGTLTARALTVELGASLTTSAGATLAVYGDWTVDGTATLAGPVAFQGSTDQALGGLGAATFTSLTVDKPAGTLTLQRAASVTGSLTLSRGLLATGAHELTITGATLSETSTAYVLGRLVTAANMNGRGTRYAFGGLGLVLTPGATGALPGVTTVRRVTGTALTGQGTSVSIKRYYDIVPATNAGLNATLEFGYRDAELNGLSEAQLELFRSSTGTSGPWQNVKASTRDAAANTVTATGVDHFSIWTLGSSANPLPVELTAFTATAEGPAAVRLNWTTTTEKNSARFEVERSPDGATFARIGTVAAAGTSSTRRTYTLRDAQLPAGPAALYYRLRQVDHDGTVSLSPVRVVRRTPAVGLTLYPNPTRHAATLGGALPGTRVQVLDALGRPVLTTTADATGTATLTLPAGRPAGVYVVRAGTQAVRLVVE